MTIHLEFGSLKVMLLYQKGPLGGHNSAIHGAAEGATTLQLRICKGNMRYYRYNLVATDLSKWFRVNVIHDVGKEKVTVFIEGKEKFVVNDQAPGDLYFKCGVYAAPAKSSNYMESSWRDIKLFKK